MREGARLAIALALGVTSLTGARPAGADVQAPPAIMAPIASAAAMAITSPVASAAATAITSPAASAAAPADVEARGAPGSTELRTPLALRPSKPLELAHEPSHAGLGWKLAAVFLVLGCAAFAIWRRLLPPRLAGGDLFIAMRTPVGFRSELLVVNVDSQRLLLGVTPHAIQMLATLDPLEPMPILPEAPKVGAEGDSLSDRFAAMLETAEAKGKGDRKPSAATAPGTRAARQEDDDLHLDSQARGLLALRRPR